MFDPNASITERTKQEEFLKQKIQEGFTLFTKDKKGFVDKREVAMIPNLQLKDPLYHAVSREIPKRSLSERCYSARSKIISF